MGALFSKPKAKAQPKPSGVSEKDKAILSLKVVRDKLRRYQVKLENDSSKLEAQAKELIAMKLKNRALLVLKLKRFKQKELEGIDSKLASVHSQIRDVEWAQINVEILKAIDAGTKELNRIHEERSLEDVQALMDDTNEAIEVENRINRVLAGQLSVIDESELELELESILKGIAAKESEESPKEEEGEESEEETSQPEGLITEPDVEKDVEKEAEKEVELDYSNMLPEAPDTPITPIIPIPAPSRQQVVPERKVERKAVAS